MWLVSIVPSQSSPPFPPILVVLLSCPLFSFFSPLSLSGPHVCPSVRSARLACYQLAESCYISPSWLHRQDTHIHTHTVVGRDPERVSWQCRESREGEKHVTSSKAAPQIIHNTCKKKAWEDNDDWGKKKKCACVKASVQERKNSKGR